MQTLLPTAVVKAFDNARAALDSAAPAPGHRVALVSAKHLAGLISKQDRLADEEAMYKNALRIAELKLGHESLGVAATLNDLALLHSKQDRLADTEAMHKEALRIYELKLGHESLEVAATSRKRWYLLQYSMKNYFLWHG